MYDSKTVASVYFHKIYSLLFVTEYLLYKQIFSH